MNRVLVVDDDPAVQFTLSQILRRYDYECLLTSSGTEAIEAVRDGRVDLVLLDLFMPELDGMETLSRLKRIDPEIPVIMVTGRGDIAAAVRATKLGAHDFITKPPDADRLVQGVQNALERSEREKSVRQLERSLEWVVGKSATMAPVIRQIRQCASSSATVLIQGEAGTGKSVIARLIHNLSKKSEQPFHVIKPEDGSSIGGSPEQDEDGTDPPPGAKIAMTGCTEAGSLFIDGLDRFSLHAQARLADYLDGRMARAVLDGGVDRRPRIIVSVERDIRKLAKERRLHEELFRHLSLSEPPMLLPSLRERLEDMRYLAGKFLWKASIEFGKETDDLSEEALDLLTRHSWPGNIRELEDVMRRSVLLSDGVVKKEAVMSAMQEPRDNLHPALTHTVGKSAAIRVRPKDTGSERDSSPTPQNRCEAALMLSPTGIFIDLEGKLVFANHAFAAIVGASNPEDLHGREVLDLVHPDCREDVDKRLTSALKEGRKTPLREQRFMRVDGSVVEVEETTFPFDCEGQEAVMVVVQDITARKRSEEDVVTRKKELEDKTVRLEEANSALKVLLSHKGQDRDELEKSIVANVKKLVLPYIQRIRAGHLTDGQIAYLDIMESSLNDIISPFLQRMAAVYSGFTPTEIQIAALVKDGKTTKEIAELLTVGTSTVHTHRNSIRSKLGLANKDANLRSYLLSLED